jgi:pyrimidine deaminase RibD-like protein
MADERECMEMAVDQARRSIGEPGRVSPKVGAVLLKGAQILGSAHRGEEGKGSDHAEFFLLERKLGPDVLAGSTLFTTLEPCLKRSSEKTPCAKRLVARRVERVYIGMLDPDPTVHGKGQMFLLMFLLEHGVKVQTFDSDLTQQILEMNRDFIADRQEPKFKILSPKDREICKQGKLLVQGTYRNQPGLTHKYAVLTRRGKAYWPQGRFRINNDGTWDCELVENPPGEVDIIIAEIDSGSALWTELYYKVGKQFDKWIGLEIEQLPDGIRQNDRISITFVD